MKLKRILSVLLILCMVIPWFSVEVMAVETDIASTIEAQIRSFADSIDKKDADDAAASALARHGMTGRGKKLSVGKDHALTATLMNSEFLQVSLASTCAAAIGAMQQMDLKSMPYIAGNIGWYGTKNSNGYLIAYESADTVYENRDWTLSGFQPYTGKQNAYDSSLEWIAGTVALDCKIEQVKATGKEAVYKVSLIVSDRFDFSTSGNSFFKQMISGIGALFFREFNWESKVSFELTVPYSCSHSSAIYRWTFDPEQRVLTSDNSGGYRQNDAKRYDIEQSYYYKLGETVRLCHDKPWVLEYDIKSSGYLMLSPLDYVCASAPSVLQMPKQLYVWDLEYVTLSDKTVQELGLTHGNHMLRHYYGHEMDIRSDAETRTFRLENVMNDDGSNMIFLTARDTQTGEMLLDRIPMDDYYQYESWSKQRNLLAETSTWVSGKDIYINYIGNQTYRFSADHFELRIWENGEGGEPVSYYEKTKVTAPTCTTKGYTTYTCSLCGHSEKADYVEATGHSWSDWENISENERQRSCTVCGETERETVSLVYGDANADGGVNALDLILLRQYLAGWDVTIGSAADANGDGSTNALDLILLRQHLAGWDVMLGQKSQNP